MTLLSHPLQRALPLFRLYPSRFPYRLKPTPHARRITTLGKESPAKLPENTKTSVGVVPPGDKEEWPSIFGEINSYLLTYGHPMSKLTLTQTSVAENGTRQCSNCNATISWENNAALVFSEEKGIYELSSNHKCAKCDVKQASVFGTTLSAAVEEINAFENTQDEGIELSNNKSTISAEDDIDFLNLPGLTNKAKAPAVDASNPAGLNAAGEVTAVKTISNLPKLTTKTKAKTVEIANFIASEAAKSAKSSSKTKSKSDVEAKAVSDSPKLSTKARAIQAKAVPKTLKSKKTVNTSKPSIEMEAVPNPPKKIRGTRHNSAKAIVDPLLNVSQAKPNGRKSGNNVTKAKLSREANAAADQPKVVKRIRTNPSVDGKAVLKAPESKSTVTEAKPALEANAATDPPKAAKGTRTKIGIDGKAVLRAPKSKNTITETIAKSRRAKKTVVNPPESTITAEGPAIEVKVKSDPPKSTPNAEAKDVKANAVVNPSKLNTVTEAKPDVETLAVVVNPVTLTNVEPVANVAPNPKKTRTTKTKSAVKAMDVVDPSKMITITNAEPVAVSRTARNSATLTRVSTKQTAVERELSKLERTESESGILNLGNDQLRHIEAMSALKLKHETMRALLETDRPAQDIVYLWNNFFPQT